jgi:hypothetical protein
MKGQIQDQVLASMSTGVLDKLRERADRGERSSEEELAHVTNRVLNRYFHLISQRRRQLRPSFANEELGLMVDACNGTMWYVHTIQYLPLEIAEAIKLDRLDEKWGVDGAGLVAKLKELDLLSLCALVDGIERFWSGAYHKESLEYSKVLA